MTAQSKAQGELLARPRLALFVIGAATGLLVTSGAPGIDTLRRLQVTHSLWTAEPPVRPDEYPGFGIPGRGGTIHAWYGLGQSIVMLPADVVSTLALRASRLSDPLAAKARPVLVCLLTFPVLAGLTLVAAFVLFTRIGLSRNVAFLGAIVLQFGTGDLAYTQIHQENSLLILLAIGGLALTIGEKEATRPRSTGGDALRLILGMQVSASAILVRLTAALDFGCVAIVAISTRLTKANRVPEGKRVVGAAAASLMIWTGMDRLYHWIRFGEVTSTYIHLWGKQARSLDPNLSDRFPFVTPFFEGFLGPFLSPQRSMFMLEPLVVLTAVVTAVRWRRLGTACRVLTLSLASLLLAHVCFYATYVDWSGASAWGDRFVTVPLHLLGALGAAVALSQWETFGSTARRVIVVGMAWAVTVQLASIAVWYNLEEAQSAAWRRPVPMPWQRFMNLAAAALGHFEQWGLSYPGFTERAIRPNFFPFLVRAYVPASTAHALEFAWVAAAALLAVAVVRSSRNAWRAQRRAVRGNAVGDLEPMAPPNLDEQRG